MRLSVKFISQKISRVRDGLRQGLIMLRDRVKERAPGLKIRKKTGNRAPDSQLKKRILKTLEHQKRGLTFQELLYCLGTEKSVLKENIEKLMGEDEVINTRRLYFLRRHRTAYQREEGR